MTDITENSDNELKLSSFTSKNKKKKAIIVAGPTASGKTGAAVALAKLCGGQVVNADSMQIYRDVPTLTARPDAAQMRGVPHRLFGFLRPDEKYGVVKWLNAAKKEADDVLKNGGVPIFVGGTGLYFDALINGVNEIPAVPPAVRDGVCARFNATGRDAFLADYLQKDPTFRFVDRQRLCRAAEVLEATGKTIGYWQDAPRKMAYDADFYTILMLPERAVLYARCDARFDEMMRKDVFAEIDALYAQNPPPDAGVLKALGVKELKAAKNGEMSLKEAVEKAKQMTRNYAKRQTTWFTRRFEAKKIISDGDFSKILTDVLHFLR